MAAKYKKSYGVEAYLQFVGQPLIMRATIEEDSQIFEIELSKFTLHKLITGIVQIVKPGFELDIPVPWNYILDFEIPKFKLLLKVPKESNSKIEFGISFDPGFDDFGLKISNIEVFARSIREVNINMKGSLSIFGLDYDLSNLFGKDGVNLLGAEGLPKPSPKPSLFDLKFIGIGQHLELKNAANYNHVNEVVKDMIKLFNPPAPGTIVPDFSKLLKFNNNSQWLFGIDVEIMKTVALQIVFNDPVLYGLYISLSGEKAKALAGLEFEILYKKITDDIGVYQIELKLPDAIRNIEFGAVSVTLPVIGISIYTNGNFKIDFGFPYNNDFSRSFAIQSFPFIGQGGFYFSYLNGATSTTVPKTELGTFDPVLEFGIGMNIGLGKTFNKGILSAGLTLTFYGILEGTLAWFKPYENAPIDNSLTDFFYRVKGTFGIVGHIYGTISFAIISATLDIVIYAQTTVIIEVGEPIYLSFEAGVSLRLTVKINLGLFKVKIHLSFSATIRESFVLGSPSQTQWNTPQLVAAEENTGCFAPTPLRDEETQVLIPMDWGQVFNQNDPQQIPVNLIPLFSADKIGDTQTAIGVSALFIENNRGIDKDILEKLRIDKNALKADSPFQPFDRLCISVLGWILNTTFKEKDAAKSFEDLLGKNITNITIANILYSIDNYDAPNNPNTDNGTVPFTYKQAVDFIKSLFVVNIIDPNSDHKIAIKNNPKLTVSSTDQKDLFLTIFPMIPQLFMSNSENTTTIDFSTENSVNTAYLNKVLALVKQFTDATPDYSEDAIDISNVESMATLIFRDYFLLIGKSLLQTASDAMEVYQYKVSKTVPTFADIAAKFATSPNALVLTNKMQEDLLAEGKTIVIAGTQYVFGEEETFVKLEKLHSYTTSDTDWASAFIKQNIRVKLFVPMCKIKLPDSVKEYRVLPEDTFETIAEKNNLNEEKTAAIIHLNKDIENILAPLTAVILPAFNAIIKSDATFLSVSTMYGIQLTDISEANQLNSEWLNAGAEMMIEYVSQLTVEDLLNAVYQKDFFTGAGGSASRFALHGVRLPNVIIDGDPGEKLEGLYDLSGQQFILPTIEDPIHFEYTFTLQKTKEKATEDPLPWVLFNGLSFTGTGDSKELATLPYPLLEEEKKLAQEFQKLKFDPTIINGPSNLKLYQDQTKTFAFSNPILWGKADANPQPTIWNFPKSLTGITPKRPEVDLNIAVQTKPNAGRTVIPIDTAKYYYSTLIPLTIRKIEGEAEEGINKKTFEVFGTDATGIELLTALLKDIHFDSLLKDLTILYSSDPSNDEARELRSISSEDLLLLLINTNLSTETNPENTSQSEEDGKISNTPITTFIERIWKSSLVRTGGYYLYYATKDDATLPDNIFSETGEAEIYILLSYDQPVAPATSNTLQPYMNSVVTLEPIDTSQELLFGEWQVNMESDNHKTLLLDGKIERNAIIKPGNVGFELIRENPNKKFGDSTGKITEPNYSYDLEQQYNLLNFRTIKSGKFNALDSVIPVGPTDNDSSTTNNENENELANWNYSKAMPVINFYDKGEKTKGETIPPPDHLSPYIGLNETLEIAFDWQDNYGNTIGESLTDFSYTILYFDEIIPLSAWPALTLEYWFNKPQEDTNNFSLRLTFKPGDKYSWNPNGEHVLEMKNAVIQQAKADILKYISVFYQVNQEDLSITFTASVDPSTNYPKTNTEKEKLKRGFINYLNTVIKWISDFIANPDEHNQHQEKEEPKRFMYTYDYKTAIEATNSRDIFSLAVNVILTRDEVSIDPQFILQEDPKIFVDGVQSILSTAKPKSTGLTAVHSSPSKKDDPLLSLHNFAEHFEQAFGTEKLKVTATYVRGEDSSLTTEKEEELWVVRLKDFDSENAGIGYDIKFDQALYYAPQPLANFLISLENIAIYPFSHYTLSGKKDSAVSKTFSNIDPEVWAKKFLAVLETTFAPNMSLPITMIDHLNAAPKGQGILAGLLEAKEKLSQAIALQTIPILQNSNMQDKGWKVAREKLRQQLLINLTEGYAISAIIQYNTNVNSPFPNEDQKIAPNLYGKPFVDKQKKDSIENNYSFSTGKIPIRDLDNSIPNEQNTYLTYTFTTQNPTLESNLPLPINYQINHIEFDITTLGNSPDTQNPSDLEKYDISKWLTFIIPLNIQDSQNEIISHIPIPIRQYPVLPAFGSQIFQSKIDLVKEKTTIEEAKLSSFSFNYTLSDFVAQDAYHFEVYFNAKKADWELLEKTKDISEKQIALFSKLAQFESVQKEFIHTFNSELPKVDASMSTDELDKITKVLGSYEELVTDVAIKWLDLYTPNTVAAATPSVDVVKVLFEVNERGSNPSAAEESDNYFEILIQNWSATVEEQPINYVNFPVIYIHDYLVDVFTCDTINCTDPIPLPEGANPADYPQVVFRYYKLVDNKKNYLQFTDGIKIDARDVRFSNLSVLQIQNGWAGFYVERNADLSGVQPPLETSEEFIYSTPVRRFNNPITPSVNVTTKLPITKIKEGENNLMDYLKKLLDDLMSTPDGKITPVKLKILTNYIYTPVSESIILPVVLIAPTVFDQEDVDGTGEGVNALNNSIIEWFETNVPIQNKGELIFSITFYSSIDGNNTLPLLTLEDLTLAVENVSDIKALSPDE